MGSDASSGNGRDDVIRVGIDTGGTFTDFVARMADGRVMHEKVLSTPHDPAEAIVTGLKKMGLSECAIDIVHGSTVATNAVLEGRGARVAFVTSRGFADLLTLARQNREHVYRLEQPAQAPPVPAERCFEVDTRIAADGTLLSRADDAALRALADRIVDSGAEAVAVSLLFCWLAPDEERRIAEAIGERAFVSLSSQVLPQEREYERSVATWMNASVGPLMSGYLERLRAKLPRATLSVMQSNGMTIDASQAAQQAVRLLLSGPAGGLAAADHLARTTGCGKVLSFDMGGTSTDVAWVEDGIPLSAETRVGPWPVPVAAVDLNTIGAGGSSLARVDAGGLLLVGPESAGADPGPACYGRGGATATVTDAHVVLGRIPARSRFGGDMALDIEAAGRAVDVVAERLGASRVEAARGIVRVANEHMARALRVISSERGRDPREATLFCFGGAGGLHACELAEVLDMTEVLVPAGSGVLSALGMLVSPAGRERAESWGEDAGAVSDAAIERRFEGLERRVRGEMRAEGIDASDLTVERKVDLRYAGQVAAQPLDWQRQPLEAAYHEWHERRFGHRLDAAVELAGIRVRLFAPGTALAPQEAPTATGSEHGPGGRATVADVDGAVDVWTRCELCVGQRISGPAIVTEPLATAWLGAGWHGEVLPGGHLRLRRSGNVVA